MRWYSRTLRFLGVKDHASVQINIGHLDDNGVYTGQYTTFALSGFIRAQLGDLAHPRFRADHRLPPKSGDLTQCHIYLCELVELGLHDHARPEQCRKCEDSE
ncbi:hypothetical protein ZIOFF_038370 [Zingiber officinale]|uniref:Uncharacterized protein n=1 Tax=Zingiber officinale TaxID=94328 RepID=A0A8J5G9T3_ZINOF|nr:hypothetical protein ZIOFF_038370 [Zingiber officinale]